MFGRGSKDKNQPDQVDLSYGFSNLTGSSEDSPSDFFFNILMRTGAMDDIFMNSLLQDDVPVPSHSHGPFSPQYRYSMMSSECDSGNKGMDCRSVPCDGEGVMDIDSFRTPPCSPPDASDNGHASFSNLSYGNYSDQSNEESPSVKLGANAILAVSLAVCKAGAEVKKIPLYKVVIGMDVAASEFYKEDNWTSHMT
ncbi:uncharacterized protein LOC141627437 [Silene latifolia]|uniref:uncharacterized protein LOC141627437 n=1 Tax=Silene latifolia TaxID=37657 RepID=UPI003D76F136